MDESKISASIAKVDRMLDRVNKVIAHEKPLLADTSYPRRSMVTEKPKPTPQHHVPRLQRDTGYSTVSAGLLTGNEMRISDYRPQPREADDDPTGMWAAFESDFDDMVAGMN